MSTSLHFFCLFCSIFFFPFLNSSLNIYFWSVHVRHLFVLSCTICCFLPSPNSSSLSSPPSHTHTHPACPLTPPPPPLRLGSNSTCKWSLALILTFLLHQMGRLCHTGQCTWCQSSDDYSKVFGCQFSFLENLALFALSQFDKTHPCGAQFQTNAVNRLQMLSEAGLLPLPGVSNAVGCGCVSDCCRLWGCGPGFREWGFL